MRNHPFLLMTTFLLSCSLFQSCNRSSCEVWDDTKSAGRQMGQGLRTLVGKPTYSRQIQCREEFEPLEDEYSWNNSSYGNQTAGHHRYNDYDDFIPLEDETGELAMADTPRPSRHSPGDVDSPIPSLENFEDPTLNPATRNIFKPIFFGYDESLIKGQQNLETLERIVDYMNKHPNLYLSVEGHTDQRGAQSYNFALGLRRSNAVRTFLINRGIDGDRIFTTSYGKDRLISSEDNESGWSQNRRDEFKIYER